MSNSALVIAGSAAFAVLCGFGAWTPAHAQNADGAVQDGGNEHRALEEVVVSVQRYSSNLQTTPVAVSAFTAETLQQRQVVNVADMGAQVPGILVTGGQGISTIARIVLRGVGQENGGALFDPAVGVYVDNVYQPRPQNQWFDLFDVERVEVLRGPQGTLYGRNTSGGAIKIVTRRPSFDLTYGGDLAFGNHDAREARGYLSGPIVADKIAGSVGFSAKERDGILDAPAYGGDINAVDSKSFRGKLLITPNDRLDIELAASGVRDRSDIQVGSPIMVLPGVDDPAATPGRDLRTTELLGPRDSKADSTLFTANIEYRATPSFTFSSITGYGEVKNVTVTPLTLLPGGAPVGISWTFDDEFFSQEFHGTYTSDRLDLVAGVYYFHESGLQVDGPPYTLPADKDRTVNAGAAFAQGTFKFGNGVSLIAGLRYTIEESKLTQFYSTQRPYSQSDEKTFSDLTPKVGVDWQVNDDLFLYASYTAGFKSGGFNPVPPNTNTGGQGEGRPTPYDEEKVDSYELGAKYTSPHRLFRLNTAVFRAVYDGLHLPVFFPGTVSSYTSNAAGARVDGIEIEPTIQATDNLQIYGALSFLHGKYTSSFPCSLSNTSIVDCQDRDLKGLIPVKTTVGFTYDLPIGVPGTLSLGADWQHVDKYWNNVSNTLPLTATPAHDLLNGFVSWRSPSERWAVSLEGRNLTDEEFILSTVQIANAVSPSITAYANDPRSVLLRVRASF